MFRVILFDIDAVEHNCLIAVQSVGAINGMLVEALEIEILLGTGHKVSGGTMNSVLIRRGSHLPRPLTPLYVRFRIRRFVS